MVNACLFLAFIGVQFYSLEIVFMSLNIFILTLIDIINGYIRIDRWIAKMYCQESSKTAVLICQQSAVYF